MHRNKFEPKVGVSDEVQVPLSQRRSRSSIDNFADYTIENLHLKTPNSRCISPIIYVKDKRKHPSRKIPIVTTSNEEYSEKTRILFRKFEEKLSVKKEQVSSENNPALEHIIENLQNTNKNDISDLTKLENRRKNRYIRSLLEYAGENEDSEDDYNLKAAFQNELPSSQDFVKECDEFTQNIVKTIKGRPY